MAFDTIGNVTIDAGAVETALSDWENDTTPTEINEWEITVQGPNRAVITIEYTE